MTAVERDQQQKPSLLAAFVTVVYVGFAVYFLLGWAGLQSLPAGWQEPWAALPLFALVGVLGAVSGLAVFRWKRWGVYGMAATWIATAVLNVLFSQLPEPGPMLAALLVIALFVRHVRWVWRFLQ
jgi:hypothetical protein